MTDTVQTTDTSTVVTVEVPATPLAPAETYQGEVAVTPVKAINETTTDTDALIAKVKEALIFSGHAVDDVWDEVVALAKKLA